MKAGYTIFGLPETQSRAHDIWLPYRGIVCWQPCGDDIKNVGPKAEKMVEYMESTTITNTQETSNNHFHCQAVSHGFGVQR